MSEQRSHYRILYPTAERPHVVAWGATHDVMDLAETGMRILLRAAEPALLPGTPFQGKLLVRDEAPLDVAGTVVRVHGHEVAVRFDPGGAVPFRVILAEQRYLRANYPLLR